MEEDVGHADSTAMADEASADETTVLSDETPTKNAELAWSHEGEWAELSAERGMHRWSQSLTRWGIAIIAVAIAGVVAAWFGTVLYRDQASNQAALDTMNADPGDIL